MATIKNINSAAGFDNFLSKLPSSQLVVIDFWATWCGPCKMIAPVFGDLCVKYPHVQFLKVDTDKQRELVQRFGISAMPTFVFIKNGQKIDQVRGADRHALSATVAKHAGTAPDVSAGSSSKTGALDGGWIHLTDEIDTSQLTCLNESSKHTIKSILGSEAKTHRKGEAWLESDEDSDEQLLINIPFRNTVRLRSISLFSPISPSQAPKSVKIFVNKPHITFSDVDTETPTLAFDLQRGDSKIEVQGIKFQKVNSVHVFVQTSQGVADGDDADEDEPKTRIDGIEIIGKLEEAIAGSTAEA